MFEKKEVPEKRNFCLGRKVQIKGKSCDILSESFCEVTIKEDEDSIEFEKVHLKNPKFIDIQMKNEELSGDSTFGNEDQENEVTDLVDKINQDTEMYDKKRWSSLVSKVERLVIPNLEASKESHLTCEKCFLNFDTKSDLLEHQQNHSETIFKCLQCSEIFDRSSSLKIHQSIHGSLRKHSCKVCHKSFTRKTTLKDHMLSHSGEKPYQCDVCKKYYRSKISLASHSRYHSKNKKYICPVCKKVFFQPSGFNHHLKSHRNKYKCNVCGKLFSYQFSLNRHVKSHFGSEKFPCDQCTMVFKQSSSLLYHKRSKHLGLKPFRCEDCDKTFTRSWSLRVHMNSHRLLQVHNTIRIVNIKKPV